MTTIKTIAEAFLASAKSELNAEIRLAGAKLHRTLCLAAMASTWTACPEKEELNQLSGLPKKINRKLANGEARAKWATRNHNDAKALFEALQQPCAATTKAGLAKCNTLDDVIEYLRTAAGTDFVTAADALKWFADFMPQTEAKADEKETAKGKAPQGSGQGANSANAKAGEAIAKDVNALLDSVLATAEEQLAAIAALALKAKDKQQAVKLFQAEALKLIQQGLTQ